MPDTASPPAPGSDPLRQLLAECIEACAEGGLPAAEALLARAPEHAAAVRERLQKLARAGLLVQPDAGTAQDAIPDRLGEFRLLRRLGAGGMGVVYLAEQEPLRRTVALKLVRPEQLFFPGARERFRREVEAIARLSDPGIVPIFTVGEDAGIPFFAMEHIDGCSLADVLAAVHGRAVAGMSGRELAEAIGRRTGKPVPETLPELFAGTWVQCVARIVGRMAAAAQHAHERGVLHRDLKPSNAMITMAGRVLLLDFGLAAAAGTARITKTGSQLGTLHYMAPEQLRDGGVDARTDVYALGITLHELLALAAPYHADSAESLRQLVLDGQPPPLVKANADVPVDLQTIARCAMDRDPARRYGTAAAFAGDLERFLAHRPITARPTGFGRRLWRACQRHPAKSTAMALVLVGVVTLPFVVAAARADAQRTARANLENAVRAIAGMVDQARNEQLIQTPGFDQLRLNQLESSMTLLRSLRQQNADDPDVDRLFARGLTQAAGVRLQLGQAERALQQLDEVAPLLRQLPAGGGDVDETVDLQVTRAAALVAVGRLTEAEAIWRGVIADHDAADPKTVPVGILFALTTSHNNLARVLSSRGELAEAARLLERSIALDDVAVERRAIRTLGMDRVRTRINLGTIRRQTGKPDEALAIYRAIAADLEVHATPDTPEVQNELARTRFAIAQLAGDRKDRQTAKPLRDQAMATVAELHGKWPDRVGYLQDLAKMEFDASVDAQLEGHLDEATTLADAAVAHQQTLRARVPRSAEATSDLATFLRQRAGLHHAAKQITEAMALVGEAIDLQHQAVAAAPEDPHYRHQLAVLQLELGMYHWNNEEWQPARDAWRGATAAFDEAIARGDRVSRSPRRLPMALQMLAQAEHMCDDFAGCVQALTRLQAAQPMPKDKLVEVARELGVADRDDFKALLANAK